MPGRPLSPEDRAILALETGVVAGHTCKVAVLAPGAPGVDALRAAIAERLAAAPLMTCRLGGTADAPEWVADEDFDVARHVVSADAGEPVDPDGLCAVVARLFAERLDRSHPLWRIDAVALRDGGRALVWRIHHALADGSAAMRYARTLLWDPGEQPAEHHAAATQHTDAARHAHLLAFLHREFAGTRAPSPFGGRIGPHRAVAFASCPLDALHDAARRTADATLNDAVLSVVAGAVRRWLVRHALDARSLRVRVPVSLHAAGDDDAGNRDSFFSLAVPVREANCARRLAAVHAAAAERKAADDAREREAVLARLGHVAPRLEHLCLQLEDSPHEFALAISNVPGPRPAPAVLGARVESLHSLAEIGRHHALRVAAVSVGDRLCVGLCADAELVPDLPFMAAAVEDEAAALVAA